MPRLVRHWQTNTRPSTAEEYRDAWTSEPAADHPRIPGDALPVLRTRVLDRTHGASDPITWWHADGLAWAAVTDLHRLGAHDDAAALARLLFWCDANGSHDDHTRWAITTD